MKKSLIASCLEAVQADAPGERYGALVRYFMPEFLAAFVLYALVTLLDARMVAHLRSTEAYATMSVTSTLVHFMIKIAEGLSVGIMVLCGYHHGKSDHDGVIRTAFSAAVMTALVGLAAAGILMCGAPWIYMLLGTPTALLPLGVPFLRLRAISIACMFFFFALIGFLRGIKQNGQIMHIFVGGSAIFLVCDYIFIFGYGPIPALGLCGSALASVVQYGVMMSAALIHVVRLPEVRRITGSGWKMVSWPLMREIWSLSLPVMGDKAVLAVTKMMLMARIGAMGTAALSSFGVIRDLELLAFIPALALAQVVTFLVSNELGARDMEGAKATIKKAMLLGGILVGGLLCLIGWHVQGLIGLFDSQNAFTAFAARAYPLVSLFVMIDVAQVILAGALRGAAQGRVVLWVRVMSLLCFSAPVMYCASCVAFQSDFVRFMTMYGAFYLGNALMAIWYIYWFRSGKWQETGWNGVL